MTAACPLRHHSPTLSAGKWSCPSCVTDLKPSPLAKLHAANDRKNTRPTTARRSHDD